MSAAPEKIGYRWHALGLLLAVAVVSRVDRPAISIPPGADKAGAWPVARAA